MTKKEADLEMMKGTKITHRYFSKSEWMTYFDDCVLFEDGCSIPKYIFWADRRGEDWEDGYELFKD